MSDPINSPLPSPDNALSATLDFLGVPAIYIAAILLLLSIQSWLAARKDAARGARAIRSVAVQARTRLLQARSTHLIVVIVASLVAAGTQLAMLRMSYAGGSLFATFFDNDRANKLLETASGSPLQFLDGDFLGQFLQVDLISACYVALTLAIMALSYDTHRNVVVLFVMLALPFLMAAVLILPLTAIAVFFDAALTLFAFLASSASLGSGEMSHNWELTRDYLLSPPYSTVYIVVIAYCLMAFLAVIAGRSAIRLWLTDRKVSTEGE